MMHFQNECIEAYAFQRAKEGKAFCGDSFYMTADDHCFLCVLSDGLGSGEYAYESSQAVATVVKSNPKEDVETLMNFSNKVLFSKRGAATAIFKVDFRKKTFEYSCVGNIRFYLYPPSGKMVYPMPVSGYLSGRPQKFRTQTFPYEPQSTFLVHSDGFIKKDSKLFTDDSQTISVIANRLKQNQINKNDDVTFIVGSLLK
ncbi:PP2C family serine/threonine-protein phosphatase [Bacillus norwichensis]|uniref:SpoIIE family protein phosphatase n=1 Tax=Bacillus norwichensis TaxID=2762217 RepID=A0ABR8VPQ8_9BACI|nr:PP2C family serine/threonine-protein phosphatase [Bacillus norwichensis]MBD8006745.1 SpoIIE family protein phosphatase [Bacillus norwichensis]